MSDDGDEGALEDSFAGGEEVEDDDGGGDGDDSFICPPPVACCLGIVLMIFSMYSIWHTEGDYVKNLQALNEAKDNAVEACNWNPRGDCSSCKLSSVKNGDLVFIACQLSNLGKLGDMQQSDFDIPQLLPLMKSDTEAGKFKWELSMWQFDANKPTTQTMNLKADSSSRESGLYCSAGAGLHHDNDPGATKRIDRCCRQKDSFGRSAFKSKYEGNDKSCQPYVKKPRLQFISDGELANSVQRRLEGPSGVEIDSTNDTLASSVQRRLRKDRKDDDRRRRSTTFSCKFRCYSWTEDWSKERKSDPKLWNPVPLDKFETVSFLEGMVATNVPRFPLANEYSKVDKITAGGFKLENFNPPSLKDQLWEDWKPVSLPPLETPEEQLPLKLMSTEKLHTNGTGLGYKLFHRDDEWTPKMSQVSDGKGGSSGSCIEGKHSSQHGATIHNVGDLLLCFEATTTTSISILAEARVIGDSYELVVSRKHLRPKTAISSSVRGFVLRKNTILTMEDMLEQSADSEESALGFRRTMYPCMLWLAFFCLLTPIVWCIDTCGGCLEEIPCIGDCLGACADVIETLATAIICGVSFCGAAACSLLIASIAWVFYRPEIGIPLLIASFLLIAGLVFFACSRRGKPKVRNARQPRLNPGVEMSQAMAQPGMMQPGMMQPGMMQPGMMQPGMTQPGMMQPGMMQPGMMQPGMMQPGMMQPGMVQPGMAQPAMAQPMMAQPAMAQPMMAQPAMAQPMMAQPAMAQPMMAQPAMAQAMAQPAMAQPTMAQPMMAQQAVAQPQMMQVVCPEGLSAGSPIVVSTPDGRQVTVNVPPNVMPGQPFMVQV